MFCHSLLEMEASCHRVENVLICHLHVTNNIINAAKIIPTLYCAHFPKGLCISVWNKWTPKNLFEMKLQRKLRSFVIICVCVILCKRAKQQSFILKSLVKQLFTTYIWKIIWIKVQIQWCFMYAFLYTHADIHA